MLKFNAATAAGPLIGLGLSRENVNRLIEGKPIQVWLRDLGFTGTLGDARICILFGETEAAIMEELKRAGLITEKTKAVDTSNPPSELA